MPCISNSCQTVWKEKVTLNRIWQAGSADDPIALPVSTGNDPRPGVLDSGLQFCH
jgi:hypothetical protein